MTRNELKGKLAKIETAEDFVRIFNDVWPHSMGSPRRCADELKSLTSLDKHSLQGLTIDGLVKKAVRECLREDGLPTKTLNELRDVLGKSLAKSFDAEKLAPAVAKEVATALAEDGDFVERIEERVAENLSTEEFDSKIAERVAKGLLDGDSSISDDVVEKVSDSVYENLDNDTLYPAIGEKVVAALQNHKG